MSTETSFCLMSNQLFLGMVVNTLRLTSAESIPPMTAGNGSTQIMPEPRWMASMKVAKHCQSRPQWCQASANTHLPSLGVEATHQSSIKVGD